jgi:Family of unknown function (DUF5670)
LNALNVAFRSALERGAPMLWTVSILFFCLWLLGVLTASTFNGYIHILLFLAAGTLLLRFFGQRDAID